MKKGLTLIEILVVITILTIVATIVFFSFTKLNERQALDKDKLLVISTLNEARSQTLGGQNSVAYGVHFNEFDLVIYEGPTYSSSDTGNRVFPLSSYTHVLSTSIAGGGDNVLFQKLTGNTSHSGTVTISLKSDSAASSTITIFGTGTIESR